MQAASKLTCRCGVTLIATAAPKKGNQGRVSVANRGVRTARSAPAAPKPKADRRLDLGRTRDLTKESVSLFSGSSFASKEEPQVWGAEPHPVPRSGTAR